MSVVNWLREFLNDNPVFATAYDVIKVSILDIGKPHDGNRIFPRADRGIETVLVGTGQIGLIQGTRPRHGNGCGLLAVPHRRIGSDHR